VVPADQAGVSGGRDPASRSAELEAARAAYRRHEWVTARAAFTAARDQPGFMPDDLYAEANCSWWLGELETALVAMEQAQREFESDDRPDSAALAALDIGYTLILRGDVAQGSGWISRARRLVQDLPDCAMHGYLLYVDLEVTLEQRDLAEALRLARRVQDAGRRHHEPALVALGVLGEGLASLREGDVAGGVTLLDEAMVTAVSEDIDPSWAGNIYCHVMSACIEVADLRRAAEWTEATARWCERMPGAGPFMGICRVHRAQVLHVRGDWHGAEQEARRVCRELAHFEVRTVAEAHYLLGDLRRLQDDLVGAEAEFTAAHAQGRDPQPGLALLRLAQGDPRAAAASIRACLTTVSDHLDRGRLLPAAVEILLAADDHECARELAEELARLAATYGSAGLAGQALHARGLLLLADGEASQALPELHQALRRWQEVDAHAEVARVRSALARAYTGVGDHDAARREHDAALVEMRPSGGTGGTRLQNDPAGLTAREEEVLMLVAQGRTNQQVAGVLVLSVRTVERHLATVYQKLGVSGRSARAAAVSHALREGLIPSTAPHDPGSLT
jgi:ATP/maltotriose-dependent transcriptional regulator MalT